MVKELIEYDEIEDEEVEEVEEVDRKELNLQQFMNDMQDIGNQLKDRSLEKPTFHYGDLSVTNYLLWLMFGELMIANNREDKNA